MRTYNRQIQIPVKVSARYKLPHFRSGGSTGTHIHTLRRLEATRVTQFSMVDSVEEGQEREVKKERDRERAGSSSRSTAGRNWAQLGGGRVQGNGSWVCLLSQIVCRLH